LHSKFSDALSFQSRVLGELQKSVMKIRMVPVDQLFRRFPRVVRDVARTRNKDITSKSRGRTQTSTREFWTRSPIPFRTSFATQPITASKRLRNARLPANRRRA